MKRSKLQAPSSKLPDFRLKWGRAAACASVLLGGAMAQSGVAPPNSGFSTHDRSDFELAALPHTCNDVKTPGDGRTYSVFTIGVRKTQPPSSDPQANLWFSGERAQVHPGLGVFNLDLQQPSVYKQIVLLQCRGRIPTYSGPNPEQAIVWQKLFYGDTGVLGTEAERHSTNARGISVWPAFHSDGSPDDRETRIAICGETFDSILPKNRVCSAVLPSRHCRRARRLVRRSRPRTPTGSCCPFETSLHQGLARQVCTCPWPGSFRMQPVPAASAGLRPGASAQTTSTPAGFCPVPTVRIPGI